MLGDLNVGADRLDAAGHRFLGGRGFAAFLASGLIDGWRTRQGAHARPRQPLRV